MSYNLDICMYICIYNKEDKNIYYFVNEKGYRVVMDEKSLERRNGSSYTNFIAETLTSEYFDINCIDNSYTGIVMAHFVSKYSHFVSVTVASLYQRRLFIFLQVNFCIFT